MCSRARLRSVWMSERKAPAIYLVRSVLEPVAALRSADACCALMSALARSYFALASFSQAFSSLPLAASHFSFATLYSYSALASSTLRWLAGVGSYFALSSAFATFSLPLASASHASFSWLFIGEHFALAAL